MKIVTILKIGDKAPAFTLPDAAGATHKLSDYKGRQVVVYFYPKDDTPGCTTQAIDFTTARAKFKRAKTDIIGISADSMARHKKFETKHELGIILLSDEDKIAIKDFGCWVMKKLYGREYRGIERTTFLIDDKGKIKNIWHKVRVKNHVAEVLEAAKSS
ncbi:MAG: thioredoxin-dependent thiol peroxidase [Alphaproteobacteria bacterium]|nr:thioredoxin-dependent thiol peroxidase [Alphaproteobacteria bacterium]